MYVKILGSKANEITTIPSRVMASAGQIALRLFAGVDVGKQSVVFSASVNHLYIFSLASLTLPSCG